MTGDHQDNGRAENGNGQENEYENENEGENGENSEGQSVFRRSGYRFAGSKTRPLNKLELPFSLHQNGKCSRASWAKEDPGFAPTEDRPEGTDRAGGTI